MKGKIVIVYLWAVGKMCVSYVCVCVYEDERNKHVNCVMITIVVPKGIWFADGNVCVRAFFLVAVYLGDSFIFNLFRCGFVGTAASDLWEGKKRKTTDSHHTHNTQQQKYGKMLLDVLAFATRVCVK